MSYHMEILLPFRNSLFDFFFQHTWTRTRGNILYNNNGFQLFSGHSFLDIVSCLQLVYISLLLSLSLHVKMALLQNTKLKFHIFDEKKNLNCLECIGIKNAKWFCSYLRKRANYRFLKVIKVHMQNASSTKLSKKFWKSSIDYLHNCSVLISRLAQFEFNSMKQL